MNLPTLTDLCFLVLTGIIMIKDFEQKNIVHSASQSHGFDVAVPMGNRSFKQLGQFQT